MADEHKDSGLCGYGCVQLARRYQGSIIRTPRYRSAVPSRPETSYRREASETTRTQSSVFTIIWNISRQMHTGNLARNYKEKWKLEIFIKYPSLRFSLIFFSFLLCIFFFFATVVATSRNRIILVRQFLGGVAASSPSSALVVLHGRVFSAQHPDRVSWRRVREANSSDDPLTVGL